MAYKELHFQSEAREMLLRGATALTAAVSSIRAAIAEESFPAAGLPRIGEREDE